MKVFISSLISGYEPYRVAVAEAVETLGHHVVRVEDFPASPGTPQQACLSAVRDSDLLVLLIGERYGYPQRSELSATHEQYRSGKPRNASPSSYSSSPGDPGAGAVGVPRC